MVLACLLCFGTPNFSMLGTAGFQFVLNLFINFANPSCLFLNLGNIQMDPLWTLWGYAVIIKFFGSSAVTEGVFSQFPLCHCSRIYCSIISVRFVANQNCASNKRTIKHKHTYMFVSRLVTSTVSIHLLSGNYAFYLPCNDVTIQWMIERKKKKKKKPPTFKHLINRARILAYIRTYAF